MNQPVVTGAPKKSGTLLAAGLGALLVGAAGGGYAFYQQSDEGKNLDESTVLSDQLNKLDDAPMEYEQRAQLKKTLADRIAVLQTKTDANIAQRMLGEYVGAGAGVLGIVLLVTRALKKPA